MTGALGQRAESGHGLAATMGRMGPSSIVAAVGEPTGTSDSVVRVQVVNSVATITLDSQGNRNALSRRLVADLHSALDRAEADDVRVIVLGHAGPAFCAGADLKERAGDHATGPADSSPMVRAMRRLMTARQPTIAVVEGAVRAGGIGLMAACDLVVVATDTTFAFTEVRIGVAPAIISVPILARCPWSKLAAPFLTGEAFDAAAARDIGLVTHVADDVSAAVRALTAGILAAAPGAVAATKRLLRDAAELDEAFESMRHLSEALFASEEGREGMAAFAEHRPPRWAVPT